MFFRGCHENSLKLIVQPAVHAGQLEFKFEVRNRAQASQDGLGTLLACKIHQQAIKAMYLRIGDPRQRLLSKLDPFDQIKNGCLPPPRTATPTTTLSNKTQARRTRSV